MAIYHRQCDNVGDYLSRFLKINLNICNFRSFKDRVSKFRIDTRCVYSMLKVNCFLSPWFIENFLDLFQLLSFYFDNIPSSRQATMISKIAVGVDWLIDSLIDSLIHWFIDPLTDWSIDWNNLHITCLSSRTVFLVSNTTLQQLSIFSILYGLTVLNISLVGSTEIPMCPEYCYHSCC